MTKYPARHWYNLNAFSSSVEDHRELIGSVRGLGKWGYYPRRHMIIDEYRDRFYADTVGGLWRQRAKSGYFEDRWNSRRFTRQKYATNEMWFSY